MIFQVVFPFESTIYGDSFNHINLNMPVPNPISENVLRRLLKMTKEQYEDAIVKGEIAHKLAAVNIDKKIEECKQYIKSGKISPNSPIGSGLMGKGIGDVCLVKTPAGSLEFKVLEINQIQNKSSSLFLITEDKISGYKITNLFII